MKKINLIIIERDDTMFDRLRQDIKEYSPYVNKIYRSTYHNDIYKLDSWYKCKLIIAHNPENAGLDFFKSLYLKDKAKLNRIYGIIYTRSHVDEINFFRVNRYLYEWSQHLFLGVIYKRYGSLEKILEIIRNIANDWRCYPIIDWIDREGRSAVIDPTKLQSLRKLHNLKHEILESLQPLITTISEFNEDKKRSNLKKKITSHEYYFKNFHIAIQNLKQHVTEFLEIEFKGKKLNCSNAKTETSFYVKQINKFINSDGNHLSNTLAYYNEFFKNNDFNVDFIVSQFKIDNDQGLLESFLREYDNFVKSLNKLINLLDEHYFLG